MASEADSLLSVNESDPRTYGEKSFCDSVSDISSENASINPQNGQANSRRRKYHQLMRPVFIQIFLAIWVIVILTTGLLSCTLSTTRVDSGGNPSMTIEARVGRILSETPLIDGHNDFAIMIRILYQNNIYSKKFASDFEDGGMRFHVDLPRLKEGRSGGAFWSAFIPCPEDGMDFSHSNYAQAVGATASQIDLIHRLTTAYADKFSDPLLDSHHALLGFNKYQKLISPIGIEGLHQIGNAFSNLRLFNSLGVKYATLTWNCHNIFADAALVTNSSGTTIAAPPYWHGLSNQKGPQIIQEMNRIGMLVDLSHVSKDTMLDVLGANPSKTKGSRAPVMFSHSSAYALCPHPRNVQDDVLQLVKKTNSIVMINFSPDFISCVPNPDSSTGLPNFDPSNSTLHQVARHVVYIASLIGYDHVGIGSDFDGMFSVPEGLEDVSKYPDLVAELLRMGVSDDDAKKIVGLNVLRVWGDAEKVAREMQAEGFLPIEDDIPEMNFTASLFTGHGVY